MGTQSSISTLRRDGKYIGIDCFLDGFLDYNGCILLKCYTTQSKVEELISLGHLYCLGENINNENDGKDYCQCSSNQFLYEEIVNVGDEPYFSGKYSYLFLNNIWYWNSYKWSSQDIADICNEEHIEINDVLWKKLTMDDIEKSDYWEEDEED